MSISEASDKETSQNVYSVRLTFKRPEFIFVLYFPLRLPSVFCLSSHLPFPNLAADVTPLMLSSRQKAWETDQLVSGGTEQVLPLTEPTQTNADPGESREKRCSKRNKGERFSLFCCTFLPPLFKTLVLLFHIPLPHLSLFFTTAVHKMQHSGIKEIFC